MRSTEKVRTPNIGGYRPLERKLRSAGGSIAVVLPIDLVRILGWKAGDAVLVSLDDKRLIIE